MNNDLDICFIKCLVVDQEIYDDNVIIVPRNNNTQVAVLNLIGFEIYKLIDGNKSCKDIGSIIASQYNADVVVVLNDILNVCLELERLGLIKKTA